MCALLHSTLYILHSSTENMCAPKQISVCCVRSEKWETFTLIYIISMVYFLLEGGEAATMQNSISNGFLPSPVKYFTQDGGDVEKSPTIVDSPQEVNSPPPPLPYDQNATSTARGQDARFGYPISGDGSYGMSGVYAPTRIDLGGVLLGAIVGFGAILILPKLLHLLTVPVGGSPHPYGRNVEDVTTGLNSVLNRVDAALERENIDSSACIQRAICESVKASPADGFINTLARNSLISSLVKGSTVEGALESARGYEGCSQFAAKCPFNQRIIASSLKNLLT